MCERVEDCSGGQNTNVVSILNSLRQGFPTLPMNTIRGHLVAYRGVCLVGRPKKPGKGNQNRSGPSARIDGWRQEGLSLKCYAGMGCWFGRQGVQAANKSLPRAEESLIWGVEDAIFNGGKQRVDG